MSERKYKKVAKVTAVDLKLGDIMLPTYSNAKWMKIETIAYHGDTKVRVTFVGDQGYLELNRFDLIEVQADA